jgi:septum formation protein
VRLVLASGSSSRLRLLRHAGFDPEVVVSGVDESRVEHLPVREQVVRLAEAKATEVARSVDGAALVVGADSLFELDGRALGKPASPADAVARWRAMRRRSGVLHTGHCVVDTTTDRMASGEVSTIVHFADVGDDEIDAYVATGEPLAVAGAFTLEGRSAPFVEGIEGDPTSVEGLSLPMLRRLLVELGYRVGDLWSGGAG